MYVGIKYKHSRFDTSESRKQMAYYISNMFGPDNGFEPYMPNEWDDYYWTLDNGNDWKIKFNGGNYNDKPGTIEIYHRYSNYEMIETICKWIAYRTGGEYFNEIEL
jgi:hypothetical protein